MKLMRIGLLITLCSATAWSQDFSVSGDIAAQAQDGAARAELAEKIISSREAPGRTFEPRLRAAMFHKLAQQPLDQLREWAEGTITPLAVGDSAADLVFTPLSPCRIIDTRVNGGAPLPAGSPGASRDFRVAGTSGFDTQGGNTTGCGVPFGATSVLINFVAVAPTGQGNLKGSAYPDPLPATGSIVNYQALSPGLNIANGLLFPICNPATTSCTDADITIAANGASVHLVADVLGYMSRLRKEEIQPVYVASNGGFSTYDLDLDFASQQPICVTTTHTTDGQFVAKIEGWASLKSTAGAFGVTFRLAYREGTGAWVLLDAPPLFFGYDRASRVSVGINEWGYVGNSSRHYRGASATSIQWGIFLGRDSGTADPTIGLCEVIAQIFE